MISHVNMLLKFLKATEVSVYSILPSHLTSNVSLGYIVSVMHMYAYVKVI